jgi:hypothetical protein
MKKLDSSEFIVFALSGASLVLISFIVGYLIAWNLYNHSEKFRSWVDNIRKNDSTHNNKPR